MKKPQLLVLAFLLFFSTSAQAQQTPSSGSSGVNRRIHQQKPYVILISLDGFRADYLERFDSPNLHRIMQQGVPKSA